MQNRFTGTRYGLSSRPPGQSDMGAPKNLNRLGHFGERKVLASHVLGQACSFHAMLASGWKPLNTDSFEIVRSKRPMRLQAQTRVIAGGAELG